METPSPSSPRAQPSPAQAETLTSPGIQSPPLKQKFQLHQKWTYQTNQKLQAPQGFNLLLAKQKFQSHQE
jgi:hypothetical protein